MNSFKGNSRNKKYILHSKHQIMYIISSTFREKYDLKNLNKIKETWDENKKILEKNIIQYYVRDIIKDERSNGGTSKIHKFAKLNKYLTSISRTSWDSILNEYFEQKNTVKEVKQVSSPKKDDIVISDCIYFLIFTALAQLSLDKFDIEHIALKDQMKSLIKLTKSESLPISSIANLCYLPKKVNRSKGNKHSIKIVIIKIILIFLKLNKNLVSHRK